MLLFSKILESLKATEMKQEIISEKDLRVKVLRKKIKRPTRP